VLDNLTAAREQMALSLAFHIVFAVFGVGLPWLLLFVERRYLVTGDRVWYLLARRWSRAFAVIFAVGAVSGTVLSFEFGLLWPTFMQRYGGVFGISFTLEAFAFFLEAIFLGLYLYGWERLPARAHWWTGVPVAVSGVAPGRRSELRACLAEVALGDDRRSARSGLGAGLPSGPAVCYGRNPGTRWLSRCARGRRK